MIRTLTAALASATCLVALAAPAEAQTREYNVPAGTLRAALDTFAHQSGRQVIYRGDEVRSTQSPGVRGARAAEDALDTLLAGTGFTARKDPSGAFAVVKLGNAPTTVNDMALAGPGAATGNESADIVVTAQKRSERLLTTPVPVTVIGSDALEREQSFRMIDYAARVPGLNVVADRQGESNIILRGITTGSITSASVSTYIDEAPFGSSSNYANGGLLSPDLDPAEVQQIEVLRGPQGTFYGASSLGGVIKFITKAPSLTDVHGRFELDGSTVASGNSGYGVRGYITAPLVKDTLGLSVSAYHRYDPGFIDNPQLGLKDLNGAYVSGGRVALLWEPTPQFSVRLAALLQNSRVHGANDEDLGANLLPLVGKLEQRRYMQEPGYDHDRLYSGLLTYDLGWATITSSTSYSTLDHNKIIDDTAALGGLLAGAYGIPNFGAAVTGPITNRKFAEEARLTSAAKRTLEWQLGFYYTHEHSKFGQQILGFNTLTGAPLAVGDILTAAFTDTYREYAGYANATLHLTSQLSVLGGIRYSKNSQDFVSPASGLFNGGNTLQTNNASDHTVTYVVSPKFQIDPNNMIYARVASGYRPGGPTAVGGVQVLQGAPASFKPDTLTNYEVGYKAALLDRQMTIEVSAFDIEWKDIQIGQTVNGFYVTANGAGARSRGIEAAVTLTPVRGLNLNANFAYTDAHLTDDAPGLNGHAGDRLPLVPRYTGNLSADYDFSLGGRTKGFVGGSYRYLGKRSSQFQQPVLASYQTVDLRAGVTQGGATLQVYVKNVGNSHGLIDLMPLGANYTGAVIQPRTLGISLRFGF